MTNFHKTELGIDLSKDKVTAFFKAHELEIVGYAHSASDCPLAYYIQETHKWAVSVAVVYSLGGSLYITINLDQISLGENGKWAKKFAKGIDNLYPVIVDNYRPQVVRGFNALEVLESISE